MKKILAFTLAETLIVIGLIGVVSALTLPNLSKSTHDMEVVAKVKKEYSVLSEAYGRARTKYGTKLKSWYSSSDVKEEDKSRRVAKRLIEYMQIQKDCGIDVAGCFSEVAVSSLDKESSTDVAGIKESYRFITNDGTAFLIKCHSSLEGCSVYIDIDGPSKGVNTFGKDIFEFTIEANPQNNRPPVGTQPVTAEESAVTTCLKGSALLCTKHVIEQGNTEY